MPRRISMRYFAKVAAVSELPRAELTAKLEAVQGETYHNRPIVIEHYRGPKEIKRCHILFSGRSEMGRSDAILAAVAGKSVATVGETEDFLDHGGMISLPAERNRVHLRVNPTAMRQASLTVSSKLLRVADLKPDERTSHSWSTSGTATRKK